MPGAEELHAELYGDVPPAGLQDRANREAHRGVGDGGEHPAVHQTLKVDVFGSGVERDLDDTG